MSLLQRTNQQRKLTVAFWMMAVGGIGIFTLAWSDVARNVHEIAPLAFAAGGGAMLFAATVLIVTVKCPRCRVSWPRWAWKHCAANDWTEWLYRFDECPKCGYRG